ncbi:hypothetical protein J1605_014147 [Eschrichtius robustus]|uniref:Uncharacterized protein n=1 Tax=Eschrichtius robustus TaxID=9764 RepID=A0AB34GDL6_ESCRO|nr:hypothetical protein J1605_014147 [Eschrichtius robustus]
MRSLQGPYWVIFSQLARFRRRVPVATGSSPRSAGVRTSSLAVGRQASPPGCPPKSLLQLISPAALTLWSPGTGCAPPGSFYGPNRAASTEKPPPPRSQAELRAGRRGRGRELGVEERLDWAGEGARREERREEGAEPGEPPPREEGEEAGCFLAHSRPASVTHSAGKLPGPARDPGAAAADQGGIRTSLETRPGGSWKAAVPGRGPASGRDLDLGRAASPAAPPPRMALATALRLGSRGPLPQRPRHVAKLHGSSGSGLVLEDPARAARLGRRPVTVRAGACRPYLLPEGRPFEVFRVKRRSTRTEPEENNQGHGSDWGVHAAGQPPWLPPRAQLPPAGDTCVAIRPRSPSRAGSSQEGVGEGSAHGRTTAPAAARADAPERLRLLDEV